MKEETKTKIDELVVLDKFEGDPVPENIIERVHIKNGEILKHEYFENGSLVHTENVKEVN